MSRPALSDRREDRSNRVRELESPHGVAESRPLLVCKLGLMDYHDAWDLQRKLAAARREDRIEDVLLLLEHPSTYTLGRRGKVEHILLSQNQLQRRKIALHHVDRGGDVTYHGPGQLVGYPIVKLPPARPNYVRYIRDLEYALLLAIRDMQVKAGLLDGFSGVWIEDRKVCAIGVKVDAHGVTTHGFAVNVNVDMSYFDHIVPCGIVDKGVTSLDRELGRRVSMPRVMTAVTQRLAETFHHVPRSTSTGRVRARLDGVQDSTADGP